MRGLVWLECGTELRATNGHELPEVRDRMDSSEVEAAPNDATDDQVRGCADSERLHCAHRSPKPHRKGNGRVLFMAAPDERRRGQCSSSYQGHERVIRTLNNLQQPLSTEPRRGPFIYCTGCICGHAAKLLPDKELHLISYLRYMGALTARNCCRITLLSGVTARCER